MTTLNKLAVQIEHLLTKGGTADSYIDRRVVVQHLRQACHKIFYGEWQQLKADGEKAVSSHYIATFRGVSVKKDEDTGENYCDLPSTYVSLRDFTGVQRVVPFTKKGKVGKAMIPIPPNAMDIYENLPAGALEGQWAYEIDRDRIWFKERCGKTLLQSDIDKVEIKMITLSFESFGDDDPLPLPPEFHYDLFKEVLVVLGAGDQVIKDLTNDNNPNIT